MRHLALVLLTALLGFSPSSLRAANTTARLVFDADTARPGDTVLAGLHLRMAPKWHTYWRNPGESGEATKVTWTLPPGITAGEIQWPVPEKLLWEGFVTYGYENEVVLIVPLKLSPDLAAGPKEIKASLTWLECEETCVPGKGTVNGTLTIAAERKPSGDAPLIEKFRGRLPVASPNVAARAWWAGAARGDVRELLIEATDTTLKSLDFLPDFAEDYEVGGATTNVAAHRIQKLVKKLSGDWPAKISGVLLEKAEDIAALVAFEMTLAVASAAPGAPVDGASPVKDDPLWLNLVYALIGGLILNIMPCVLPVVSLKIFGFIRQAGESPARLRALGLAYGVGVVVSLMVLAGFVIALKNAGQAAGWGVQFQSPVFVVAVIVLVTLVALNLFGVFEVTLSGSAMDAASGLASREGLGGAFFNGALAVVLATPCTAPILAGALGFAFRQSTPVIVLFFITIGIGLALPYVLLCFAPKLMKFLPKPGAWMEKFKIALGFPVIATALWLFADVAPAHFGDKLFWLGMFLVMLAVAAWVFGEFYQRGRKRRGLALAVVVVLLAVACGYALEVELNWRHPAAASAGTRAAVAEGELDWQPWSAEAVAAARSAGRVVLVDFTAKWCVTCQVNKKTSINIPSAKNRLRELNALLLRGDFTRQDPVIAAELQRFNRAGVPLVLVYPRDASKPPLVLPEVLTPGIVLEALKEAAR
jgi:thiol:disulfide interchange protein DsbD